MNNLIHFTVCQVKWVLVEYLVGVLGDNRIQSNDIKKSNSLFFLRTKDIQTIGEVFDDLEKRYHIIISYNASQINPLWIESIT